MRCSQEGRDPLVGIVILNYNGFQDTIECLASLAKQSYCHYLIVLIDNGSSDGSVARIIEWGQQNGYCFSTIRAENEASEEARGFHILVALGENLGFAKACNLGARLCSKMGADYVFFLNNDTVLDSDCLRVLVDFMEANKRYHVATPKILYFENPDRVWNCGGKITWYGRRIYYTKPDKHKKNIDSRGITYFDVGLVTGCALFVRKELIREGCFFTEKFFFGEEDFEFSLRAKKMKIKMACVLDAVVFHKVGGTVNWKVTDQEKLLGRVYIYCVNRLVNLRQHYRYWWWVLWREVYLLYICWLLRVRYKVPMRRWIHLARKLRTHSACLDEVTREIFEKALRGEWSK